MKVKFKEWNCDIMWSRYMDNDRVAIILMGEKEGSVAIASVNLEEDLEDDHVFIKDWSENEGMVKALVDAGIVEDTGRTVRTGYVQANVCKLLVKPEIKGNQHL